MKVRIEDIKAEQRTGKNGPYWLVRIKTGNGGWAGGFVDPYRYDPNVFKVGNEIDVTLEQNGKYTNFKLPPLPKESQKSDHLMEGLRKIYKKLLEIERRLPPASESVQALDVFDDSIVDEI